MTDIEQEPAESVVELHVVKGAYPQAHVYLGTTARTARWTLAVVVAGRVKVPGFRHHRLQGGGVVSSVNTLYYDN